MRLGSYSELLFILVSFGVGDFFLDIVDEVGHNTLFRYWMDLMVLWFSDLPLYNMEYPAVMMQYTGVDVGVHNSCDVI
jgi:hypothetical protein